MVLGTENKALALIAVANEDRESSWDVIQKLHALGIRKTVMLTGDNRTTADIRATLIVTVNGLRLLRIKNE
ncbi:P-type E1-E2 ATPase [Paenibacillus sp. PvR052]|nr:P-type E1-E2 ATPase [Paenibacillus sp. PvP091]MBP1170945.1 P-type E1-E2 ATPase [Paenibacillus sp. PvR098]MBP2441973.1 P-type E1-E2 ATPase [Paenibacillus sp. PvP052]